MVDTVMPHHSFQEISLTVFDSLNCITSSLAKERIELERICLHKLQFGLVSSGAEVHELCRMFSNQSQFKFCPGIEWDFYEEH